MINHSFFLNSNYFLELFEDIPSYKLYSQLYGISNHPVWQIGHITNSFDEMNTVLTGKRALNDDWAAIFGTGSRPQPIQKIYPEYDLLIRNFRACRTNLSESLSKLSMADYTRPNPVPRYAKKLYTLGDLITHVTIGHLTYHCGQLVIYRAIHGLYKIPEAFDESGQAKTSENNYECQYCNARFTQRITLSKHLKNCDNRPI